MAKQLDPYKTCKDDACKIIARLEKLSARGLVGLCSMHKAQELLRLLIEDSCFERGLAEDKARTKRTA